jgi:hypothetical protein
MPIKVMDLSELVASSLKPLSKEKSKVLEFEKEEID